MEGLLAALSERGIVARMPCRRMLAPALAIAALLLGTASSANAAPELPPSVAAYLAPARILKHLHRPPGTPLRLENVRISYSDAAGFPRGFAFVTVDGAVGDPGIAWSFVFHGAYAPPPRARAPAIELATNISADSCGGTRLESFDVKYLGRIGNRSLVVLNKRFDDGGCAGDLEHRTWTQSLVLDETRRFKRVYAFERSKLRQVYRPIPGTDAGELESLSTRETTFDPPERLAPPSPEDRSRPALTLHIEESEGTVSPTRRHSSVTLRWDAAKARLVDAKP